MVILGQVKGSPERVKFVIHPKCKNIIMYQLSETQVIENPDDKACHFWLTCPTCKEQFEVNNGYAQG